MVPMPVHMVGKPAVPAWTGDDRIGSGGALGWRCPERGQERGWGAEGIGQGKVRALEPELGRERGAGVGLGDSEQVVGSGAVAPFGIEEVLELDS